LLPVAFDGALVATLPRPLDPRPQVGDQAFHVGAVGTKFR